MLIIHLALTAAATTPIPASAANGTIAGGGGDRFGFQIVAGDLNDDSIPDVVVSAPHPSAAGNAVYVFFGPIDLSQAPSLSIADADVVIEGPTGTETGWAIVTGDLMGGSEDDLVVSAPSQVSGAGRISVFEGPLNTGTVLSTSTDADFILDGVGANAFAGWSLAAGDWDGDGRDELGVGACQASNGNGAAYLLDLDTLTSPATVGSATSTFTGIGLTGCSMSNLGDFDGDGFEDLGIGSYGAAITSGVSWGGTVSIVYGRGQFDPSYSLLGDPAEDITNLNGELTGSNLGYDLAPAGDMNFDGFDDLWIGSPATQCDGCIFNPDEIGRAYVVLGAPSNGTNEDRPLVGNSLIDAVADMIYEAPSPNEGVGLSVSAAGFVGPELGRYNSPILKNPLIGPVLLAGSEVDQAWVIAYNNQARLYTFPEYVCEEDPDLGLTCFDPRTGIDPARGWRIDLGASVGVHRIDGDPDSALGFEVCGPGDLDGDGRNDIVVGATQQLAFDDPAGDGEVLLFQGY